MLHHRQKLLLILTVAILIAQGQGQLEGDSCRRRHDGSPGICTSASNCPQVKEEYKLGIRPTRCGSLPRNPIVCCPEPSDSRSDLNSGGTRISSRKCETYKKRIKDESTCEWTEALLIGAVKTKKGEFPHMAAIGWRSDDGTLSFKCGGSLISHQFVLTAAHCSQDKDEGEAPSFVRLGDQNLRNRNDGMDEIDIPIAEFIIHEDYDLRYFYYDIGLIRLSERVKFNKFIRPACLWQTSNIASNTGIVTGWGYTEFKGQSSDELRKVELDIIPNAKCNNDLKISKLRKGVDSSQVCAGVYSGGKDICDGDSGGPIQILMSDNYCIYHIVGVTSVGNYVCGRRNGPGLFTRVSAYLPWIEEKVWGQ